MAERRKFKRFEADCRINIELENSKNVFNNLEVNNIGGGGLSFIYDQEIPPGEIMKIHFPSITLRGYVIWRQGIRYGVMFVNPLGDELQLICQYCLNN